MKLPTLRDERLVLRPLSDVDLDVRVPPPSGRSPRLLDVRVPPPRAAVRRGWSICSCGT
jgi:hypothetical protein